MFKAYKQHCNHKDVDCQACLAKFNDLEGGYVIPPCNTIPVQQQAAIIAEEIVEIIRMRMICESGILDNETTKKELK